MFSIRNIILAALCIAFTSCYKRYIGTRNVCRNLYVEIYDVNLAGGDACYLTDSINFRILVGKFDPENGNYKFQCDENIVYIEKLNHSDRYISDTVNIVAEKKVLNLDVLKRQHKFE
jgi:hypothetical protein